MLWCPNDRMNTPLSAQKAALCFLSLPYCLCDVLVPFFCLCFAQVASVLLQCLAALPLLGDPLGLEGCQHSVQPQPFQALWAQREAKCSARGRQQPALEDLGKPGRNNLLAWQGYAWLPLLLHEEYVLSLVGKLKVSLVCLFKRQEQLEYKTKTHTPKERMCMIFLVLITPVLDL